MPWRFCVDGLLTLPERFCEDVDGRDAELRFCVLGRDTLLRDCVLDLLMDDPPERDAPPPLLRLTEEDGRPPPPPLDCA